MAPLLSAQLITKTFAGVRALRNVSFELRRGEVHALIGENGAGKSTLIKVMTGAVQPDSGALAVSGRAVPLMDPAAARSLGIAAIYQQPALFPHLSVAENMALALESGGALRRVRWREMNQRATALIARVGGAIDPDRLAGTLSMPEQQLVEIAKALGANAKALIMDEPTASLTHRETELLFDVIAALRRDGVGIIYISHRLEEIASIADRVTVLRDGETIATFQKGEASRQQLIALIAGREMAESFREGQGATGGAVLEVRRLGSPSGLRDISFSLRAGEILGFAGLVGSGRTRLAEALFGLTPADSGEILLRGRSVRIGSPENAIRLGIGYVPEDRRRHGVILDMPVSANVSLANLKSVSHSGLLRSTEERRLAEGYVARLRIKAPSVDIDTATLSGGNQQKVALARWLAINPLVLILDEPTQGVDVGSKAEIHRLIADLASRGVAIVMISSELAEVLAMSDRIAVMRDGALQGLLGREEATQEKIMSLVLEDRLA
ncbi:MAG TPA: sugar ABC transporter ATP-binding protein [Terriglobia bacterium]|nr:sugar ABC transporter ATP-binding protein [Terriglobia bacterium]